MGQVNNFYNKGISITPSKAQYRHANEEVADCAYVECEEPLDFDHGVVWAHSLGASPPDLFGEILAWMEFRAEQCKAFKPKWKGR
jgi:hypothetical protein